VLLLDLALLALFVAADIRSGVVMAVLISAAIPIAWLLRRNRSPAPA
jgi:hypothetical protein